MGHLPVTHATPSASQRAVLAGIVAFSAVQLGFELLVFKLTKYQYATLSLGVIGIALLGVAGAGVLVRLARSPERSLRLASLLCGPVALLTGAVLFHQHRLGQRGAAAGEIATAFLIDGVPALLLFALTSVPLFAALQQQAIPLARSYGSSFLGGAIGTLLTLGLLQSFGDVGAFCVLIALCGVGSALLLRSPRVRLAGAVLPVAVALLALPLLGRLDRRSNPASILIKSDALSRIDVERIDEPGQPPHLRMRTAGINGATSTSGVPNRGPGNPLERDMRHLAYTLGPRKALIMGSGAGREVVDGLRSGAQTIYGVEINPLIPEYMRRVLPADHDPYRDPAVRLYVAEGREVAARLRHDPNERNSFDLVYAPVTIAIAASGQVFSHTHLITQEALSEYMDLLAPRGIVAVLFPNIENVRAKVATALARALPPSDTPAEQRIAVLQRNETSNEFFAVLARADGPFLPAERQQLANAPAGASALDVAQELRAGAALRPLTDDNPFLFNDPARTPGGGRHIDWNTRVVRRSLALAALLLLVLWALAIGRGPRSERLARSGLIGYFAAIGAGYVIYQSAVLQRLSFLTGHPVLATAVVLTATLVASGIGSLLSQRALGAGMPGRRAAAGVALLVWIAAVALAEPRWLMASGWSVPVRLAVAALVAMPPFVVMGTYFPIGLKLAERETQGLLSWCWAANGVASILGSSLLLLVSMGAGVRIATSVAGLLYATVAVFELAASRGTRGLRVAGLLVVAVVAGCIAAAAAAVR